MFRDSWQHPTGGKVIAPVRSRFSWGDDERTKTTACDERECVEVR